MADAGRVWMFDNATVEEVGMYSKVFSGTTHVVMHVKLSGIPSDTGCVPTDTHGLVFNSATSNFGSNMQLHYSTLLSAEAQGKPVDILIDDSNCNTYEGWDRTVNPTGLGYRFVGVIIDGDG